MKAWQKKLKRGGVDVILDPRERAMRELFQQRMTASHLAAFAKPKE